MNIPLSVLDLSPISAGQGEARAVRDTVELAQLVRYEHMEASLDNPQFSAAIAKLKAADDRRQRVQGNLEPVALLGGVAAYGRVERGYAAVQPAFRLSRKPGVRPDAGRQGGTVASAQPST